MKKIIFFITLFLIAVTTVLAEEVTLIRNKIDNTYTYYYDQTLGRDRFLYANKYTFGDTIAYCLEMGKLIESNIYTYTTSFEELNYDKGKLDFIKLIAYYGYDYPGHNTDNYYMAAQELIWNRLTNKEIKWVINMEPDNYINVEKEKSSIMKLFKTHYDKPSFDGMEIEYSLGEELELVDTNNILNRYVAVTNNVKIEGNKLILTKDFNEEEIILKHPNHTGKQFLLYTSGVSQKMISTGGLDDVTSTIKVKIIGGSLELNKLDKDLGADKAQGEAILDGAIYNLYDEEGNVIDTITTGSKNKIDNLPLGKYTLKEVTPSKGYLLDENIYVIDISGDNLNVKLDVYEEVIKRKVEVFKVFSSNATGALIPEPGISFEIYGKDNILIDTITTDNDGYTSIILPYGVYTFKQINTTENYYKVEDFTITILEYDERPIYKLLSDSQITAKVRIIKKDMDTKENIKNSNIKFKIYDVKNDNYLSLNVIYPDNKYTSEFQVDKNGIFITPVALLPGTYILEEISEDLDGYLYNNDKITFTIDETSDFVKENDELYLEIPFYNKRVKGSIEITKYGEEVIYVDNLYNYKKIPLEGVILNLYAKEDIYENNKLIYKQDELIKEIVTNKDGIALIEDIPLGKYYIKEKMAVGNHILNEEMHDITLLYIDEYTDNVKESIVINNYLPKGNLIINKYQTGTQTPIPNTLIEIYNTDNKIIYKGYTDKNGQIIIEDIPYGEYYLSEVEASTGYRLLEEQITINIDKKEEIINIYNERIEVPNTGLSLNNIDIFIIVTIILSITLIIFFYKEKLVVILSIILILLGITYFVIKIYNYYNDYQNNKDSVEAYINKEIDVIKEEKYQYSSVLEVPSVNIKRGVLNINNQYNDAKYNIELIKENENTIILAAHNGNNPNSYFGNLKNIELGDEIKYYKDGIMYTYIYSESYDIRKSGYADIYRNRNKKSIILITCKDNTDDAQTVYIGYLKEESNY